MTDETIVEGVENQPAPKQRESDSMVKPDASLDVGQKDTTELEGKLPNSKVNPDAQPKPDTTPDMGQKDTTNLEGKLPNSKVNPEPMPKLKQEGIDDTAEATLVSEQDTPDVTLSEDIKSLLEGIDLPEEFKTKALGLFEGAVSARISDIKKEMFAINETAMETYKTSLSEKVEQKTDAYVSEAVAKWLEENQTSVKTNIRTQIAESFMANLLNLLESHYITIPDGKEDILEAALAKADVLEAKVTKQAEEITKLKEDTINAQKAFVVESLVKQLTDTQAERVRELAESIEFDSSEVYSTKLSAIVENITKVETKASSALTEDVQGNAVVLEDNKQEVKTKAVDPFVQRLHADMKKTKSY